MRFLFDLSHPAHVHFSKYLLAELEGAGHETMVVARDKDVTLDLLRRLEIPHVAFGRQAVGRAARGGFAGLAGMAWELAQRDWKLWRLARSFRPDVIVTRNPAGVQAARLARVRGVFDTDDGKAVGVHFRTAAPFAHAITTPDCIPDDFGPKHVKYPSYKALAFLHPNRFTPDPSVTHRLGLGERARYSVVRFVALAASHDRGERGLTATRKRDLIRRLEGHGPVFVTSEAPLPPDLTPYALPTSPDRFHDVLAGAQVCVTDGQSVAAEAAVLGVPAIRCATTTGRIPYLTQIAERYGLVAEYQPEDARGFEDHVEHWASESDLGWRADARDRLLADKCDLTAWMAEFLTSGRPPLGSGSPSA